MNIEKLTMPNGVTINAVLVKKFDERVGDNDFLLDANDMYYGQNRLFIRKYRYEVYPDYSGDEIVWVTNIIGEVQTEVIVEYCVIPELDDIIADRFKQENPAQEEEYSIPYAKANAPSNGYNLQDIKCFLSNEFPDGIQCFDSRNTAGDHMETIYGEGGVQIDYCPGYDYIEIFGLTPEDFREVRSFLGDI